MSAREGEREREMNSAWKLALLFAALSCAFQIRSQLLSASIAVAVVVFLFTDGAAVIVDLAKKRRRNAVGVASQFLISALGFVLRILVSTEMIV